MSFGLNFGNRNYGHYGNYGNYGNPRLANQNFVGHICNYIGETVTVFTTSGGASGCGFTGVLLSVNCDFLRISTQIGAPPANPLSENICGEYNGFGPDGPDGIGDLGGPGGHCGTGHCGHCGRNGGTDRYRGLGSVVDIPLCKIAAFCHNAV